MINQFTYTEDSFAEVEAVMELYKSRRRFQIYIILAVVFTILAIVCFAVPAIDTFFGFACLAIVLYFLTSYNAMQKGMKLRKLEANKGKFSKFFGDNDTTITTELKEDGVILTQNGMVNEFSYDNLAYIGMTINYMVLYFEGEKSAAVSLDRKGYETGSEEEAFALLQAKKPELAEDAKKQLEKIQKRIAKNKKNAGGTLSEKAERREDLYETEEDLESLKEEETSEEE